MFYFLVSGYIPGTDIQITFEVLVMCAIALVVTYLSLIMLRNLIMRFNNFAEYSESFDEIAL
jgi:hypothetical protein